MTPDGRAKGGEPRGGKSKDPFPVGAPDRLPAAAPLGEVFADSRKVSRFFARRDPHEILAEELGPSFGAYRARWERARTFKEIPPFPLHVDYELKRQCDLRCPMCLMGRLPENGAKAADAAAPKELSAPAVIDLIDQGAAAGQMAMGFGGLWEPLTSPAIPALVAHGRGKGLVDAMFNTNGLRLSPEVSSDLIRAGLTRLMVSLDAATEATYNLMRPGSDFRRVTFNVNELLAIRARKKSRLPLVRLSFCLTSLNEAELPAFVRLWEGKADFISVQRYGNFGGGPSGLFPKEPPLPAPSGRCAQPFKRLSVLHDGSVLPCCDLSGLSLSLGSALEGGLGPIWRGDGLRSLRESLLAGGDALPPACRRCQEKFGP